MKIIYKGNLYESESIMNWFGKSKIKDSKGNPVICFHGTMGNFDTFDIDKSGQTKPNGSRSSASGVIYFTYSPEIAASYAGQHTDITGYRTWSNNGNIIPAYLKVEKPLVVNCYNSGWRNIYWKRPEDRDYDDWTTNDIVDYAKTKNYDGVVFKKILDFGEGLLPDDKPSTVIAVFNSNQIKSIFNKNPSNEVGLLTESVNDLEKTLEKKYGASISLSETNDYIVISQIIVPKELRGSGIGGKIMTDIIEYADRLGLAIYLNLATKSDGWGTTSESRLEAFYRQFGFVRNKGKNKNYSISYMMYREPNK